MVTGTKMWLMGYSVCETRARTLALCLAVLPAAVPLHAAASTADMQKIGHFFIDRTEVTVGQFARFAEATATQTKAEREGGGLVYAAGWRQMSGWTWRAPFSRPAGADEPAVHVTFDEARAYCKWAGKRLPKDAEWLEAAYVERRSSPPLPYLHGKVYPYPTGDSPEGANCLAECGPVSALDHSAVLQRGRGVVDVVESFESNNGDVTITNDLGTRLTVPTSAGAIGADLIVSKRHNRW